MVHSCPEPLETAGGLNGEGGREGATSAPQLLGVHYLIAPILPALVGTTLPLWLRPNGYTFRWLGALEFFVAVVLMHTGFLFLLERFEPRATERWPDSSLLRIALTCIGLACVLGLHLSRFTTGGIFIVFGLSTIFAGLLYVAPPVMFSRHAGGEIVLAMSLSFLPVLGAYLVQTGDLTRPVYIAALPIYAATGLWVWTDQLLTRKDDEKVGRVTLVTVFGARISGRVVVPAISVMLWVMLVVAVLSASVMPLALAAFVLLGAVWGIVLSSWNGHEDDSQMIKAHTGAIITHLGVCLALAASSLLGVFR